MVQMVVFINLFFIPVISVYIINKNEKKLIQFNLDLLIQYCIVAACNIPLTKAFTFTIGKISGIAIFIDSGYYTSAALLSAIFLPGIYQAYVSFHTYPDKRSYFKRIPEQFKFRLMQRGMSGIINELAPSFLLVFTGCFMLFVYEPILMYSTNKNDFWFDFSIMIWPVIEIFLKFLLFGIIMALGIYFVNLLFSSQLLFYKGMTLIVFFVFFILYLQGNWLAEDLPVLTGEEIAWESYGKAETAILISIMIALGIAILFCIWIAKLNCTVRYSVFSTAVILVMLSVSLIATVAANNAMQSKDAFSPTTKNLNTISTNQNFLILLVDTVDSESCYEMIKKDKDFSEMLDDFTFYPDTLGAFPVTRDSIPVILAGADIHDETSFIDYCAEAYNNSPFFNKLNQDGYAINLYSPNIVWNGERNYDVKNSTSIYDIKVDVSDFMKEELKYIKYKYLPYMFKKYSEIESLDFNICRIVEGDKSGYNWLNQENASNIIGNHVLEKVDENYFQFVHCEGAHKPYNLDKYLNVIEDGTYEQKTAASLMIIKRYLQRLKDNNAYDNSVIVIMSDHGSEDPHPKSNYVDNNLSRCNPILFIKGINEKHELNESDRPVSYHDLQGAFCDLIDGKKSTELFSELEIGRKRKMMWTIWYAQDRMLEYETTGHARDIEAFIPTGKIYDLKG